MTEQVRTYTAEDFDENGEFIRNPTYMAPRSVVEQAVVQPRSPEEENAFETQRVADEIAVKKKQIAEERLRLAKAEALKLDQTDAVTARTNREPVPYQRPYPAAQRSGTRDLSIDDMRERRGEPRSTDPSFGTDTPDKFTFAENAAANGVDVSTGLDPEIRAVAQLLAFNPPAQQTAIENEVRAALGPDFPAHVPVIGRDPASGMTAYRRKEKDGSLRWTLVNPPGMDVGDVVEFAGDLPTFVMETAGAVAGGIVGSGLSPGAGTVAGATAGATLAGAASIPLRVQLAKWAGIPDEVINKIDVGDEAAWQALMSGGGELAGHTIIGAVSSLRNFFGRSLDIDDIPALQAEIRKNQKTIREAEEVTGVEFNPSLGQLTGDTDVQIAEASLKGEATGKTAHTIRAADIDNDKAAAQAVRNLSTQEVRSPTASGFRSVQEISDEVEERLVKQRTDIPAAQRDAAQTEVDSFDEMYESASNRDAFTNLQEGSAAAKTEARRVYDEAWDLHRKAIEWDDVSRTSNIQLDNMNGPTPIRAFMDKLNKDQNQALMTHLATANAATLKSAGFGPDDVARMMEGGDPTGLASATLDTRHLHTVLSNLKRTKAQMQAGPNPNGFELNDVDGLIEAIEKQMNEGTFRRVSSGRPVNPQKTTQIRDAWVNANNQTEHFHATFSTDAMRALLKPRRTVVDGRVETGFDLPPGFIRNRLFAKGDARFLQEATSSVGHDPVIRQALAEEFMKHIRTSTIRDGRVHAGKFNEFMDLHQDHMDLLFSPEDMGKITNLGSMGRVVDNMAKKTEQLSEALKVRYGRVVAEPTSPFNIAEEILGPRMSAKQATNLMNDVRRLDPRLAAQVEEKVMERIFNGIGKGDKKLINFNRLDDLLVQKRDTLMAVGGRRYVKDLDTLRDALEIMAEKRFSKPVKMVMQGPWQRATRLLFGPLGREQRFISAVGRAARASRAGTVKSMLANPDELRRFAKLKNMTPTDPRFWAGVMMFGDNDLRNVFIEGNPDEFEQFQRGELKDRRSTELKGGL